MAAEGKPIGEEVLRYREPEFMPRPHIIGRALEYQEMLDRGETPSRPTAAELDEIKDPENVTRRTFPPAEGRQWLQVRLATAILRMMREDGFVPNLELLDGPKARHRLATHHGVPREHVGVPALQKREVPRFWGQIIESWLMRYTFSAPLPQSEIPQNATHLPERRELHWFMDNHFWIPYYSTSGTKEERGGIHDAFDEIREFDPEASLSADELIRRSALPGMIMGDGHWILNPYNPETNPSGRARPGNIFNKLSEGEHDPHASAMLHLIPQAQAKSEEGRTLTPVDRFYLRTSEVLDEIGKLPGGYDTWLPEYAELIAGYKKLHPGTKVKVLHRR